MFLVKIALQKGKNKS